MLSPGALLDHVEEWWRDLRVTTAFLTRIPITCPPGTTLAETAVFFPIVGMGVGGAAAAGFALAFWLGLPPLACALTALAVAAGVTGALHEDGLADMADGFGGGVDRARKLDIMRDSRIGTFGVVALIFSVGLRASALAAMGAPWLAATALIAAGAVSRGGLPVAMLGLDPVRQGGLGAGAGRPNRTHFLGAVGLGALVAILALGLDVGLAALLSAGAAGVALAWLAVRQIGGQTGDVLGALQQVTETAVLLTVAATS
jgi:adenosylcobinamide-GDP ribazoletransferase